MALYGTGTANVTTNVVKEKKAYIKQRAHACHRTESMFVEAIIDDWFKRNAPVMFDNDKHIPVPIFPKRFGLHPFRFIPKDE